MIQFLSEEWFARFGEELGRLRVEPDWPPLDLGQEILDAPQGTVQYTIHVAQGSARLVVGSLEGASATLVEDFQTAQAIVAGSSISELLSKGKITIRGDASALVRAQVPLAALAATLGELGTATEI